MAGIGNGVVIRFFADTSGAIMSIGRLESAIGRSTTVGEKFGLAGKAIAGALATAAIAAEAFAVKLGVEGVKAAIDDEQSVAALNKTLTNLGFGPSTDQANAFIDSLQRQVGVADDALRPALARLTQSIGDVGKAESTLQLALDISAGTHKDLSAVVGALGKAYDGNVGALGRLGVGIDKATLKTGDMGLITQQLAQRFGGDATTAAQTYEGQIKRLSIGFDELKESFGYGFLGALGTTNNKTNDLMATMKNLEPVVQGLGRSIGGLGAWVAGLVSPILQAKAALGGLGDILSMGLMSTIQRFSLHIRELAANISGNRAAWNEVQTGFRELNGAATATTGVVQSSTDAIDKNAVSAVRNAQAQAAHIAALNAASTAVDKHKTSVGGASAKVEELGIKWATVASDLSALSDQMDVEITGKAIKISGNMVKAFEDRRDAFKAVVQEQTAIIKSALDAVKAYSDDVVKSFTEFKLGDFISVDENTGTTNFLADAFNKWITDKTAIASSLAPLITILPEALTQQVLAMDPSAAKSVIDYFTNNPGAAGTLTTNLDNLTKATRDLLADPMANVFAKIGDQSAMSMIANAKATIADEADAFQAWVRSKLKTRVTVEVQYVAVNTPPVGARALGGPVESGSPYIVGERGPELFMPNVSGTIIPNDQLPMLSGGGTSVAATSGGGNSYTVNVSAGVGDPRAIGQTVIEYIKKFEKANGPVFAAA